MPLNGNSCIRRVTDVMIMWMLVDSSGSTKPLASPSDTTVLVPRLAPAARADLDLPRLANRLAADRSEQLCARFIVGEITAAVDEAVADSMLERDVPAPARFVRDRARCRAWRP